MSNPECPEANVGKRIRWYQVSVRGMVGAVVCCAVLVVVGQTLWEYVHPAAGQARLLQRSRDSETRKEAARGLASAEPQYVDRAVVALISALKDDDPGVRSEAANSLRSLMLSTKTVASRSEIRDALVSALSDRDQQVRTIVVNVLGEYQGNTDPIIMPMLRLMEQDDPLVRTFSDQILNRQGRSRVPSPALVPELARALKSPVREVRYRAAELLSRIGPKAIQAVPGLIGLLGEPAGPNVANPMQALSTDEPIPSDPSSMAAYALGKIAPGTTRESEAIAALEETLRSDDVKGRRGTAAQSLLHFGLAAPRAVPALLIAFKKAAAQQRAVSDPSVSGPGILWRADDCAETAQVLAKLGPSSESATEAIAVLVDVIRHNADISRRQVAALTLMRFGPEANSAIPSIIAALKGCLTADSWEGGTFANALGTRAPGSEWATEAVAVLTDALDAKNTSIRAQSCRALARFGPAARTAVAKLRGMKQHPDTQVRDEAAAALKRIETNP